MRPTTRLFTRVNTFKTSPQTAKRHISTSQPKPSPKLTMSAPGIPSTTPLQSQSDPTQPPSQSQGLTQKSGVNTATGPVAGNTPAGVGAGPTAVGGGSGLGGSGIGGSDGGEGGDAASYGITSTDLKTAAGVELSPRQRVLVGGVLDVSSLPSLCEILGKGGGERQDGRRDEMRKRERGR